MRVTCSCVFVCVCACVYLCVCVCLLCVCVCCPTGAQQALTKRFVFFEENEYFKKRKSNCSFFNSENKIKNKTGVLLFLRKILKSHRFVFVAIHRFFARQLLCINRMFLDPSFDICLTVFHELPSSAAKRGQMLATASRSFFWKSN